MSGRQRMYQSFLYLATIAFGQGLSFLVLPIVTRLLPPEVYGQYALALTVSNLLAMLASSWIRNVSLRLYYDAVKREQTLGFYLGTAALQVLTFTVLYASSLVLFHLVGFEIAPLRVMISAGVAIVLGDQFAYAVILIRAQQRTGSFAVAEIGSGAIRFSATVLALTMGFRSPEVLFDAASLGYLLGAAYAVPTLMRRLTGVARLDLAGALEVVRYGPRSLPFSVSGWFERMADRLVIEHFIGTAAVGVYSIGYALGERLIGGLVQGVFMMAWPSVLNAWNERGVDGARDALVEAQRLFAWFTVGPVFFLVVYGTALTEALTGAEYHSAAIVVPIVAVSIWLGGFGSYLNRHLELEKRFGTLSLVTAVGAAVNVGLNIVLVPRLGLLGAAIATLVNRVLNTSVYFVMRNRSLTRINVTTFRNAALLAGGAYATASILPVGDIFAMATFVGLYGVGAVWTLLRSRTASATDR